MTQLTIPANQSKIEEAFWKFHGENPDVYEALKELAFDAHEAGRTRIGIGMLFEVLRWNRMIQRRQESFKLNNNFRAYYARLLMKQNPELDGLFETRELTVPSHVVP